MKLGDRALLGMARRLAAGCLELTLSDGSRHRLSGSEAGPTAAMTIRNPRLARRLLVHGALGFAEGFMAGEFDTPDLEALLRLAAVNQSLRETLGGRWYSRVFNKIRHGLNRNSRAGSRRNILAHYDLGNDFYRLWLDPGMTYSSAVFGQGQDLAAAQDNKYRLICEVAHIGSGASVLEIGCGWGGFASYAARERGAKVTALTISDAQYEAASRRMQAEGLNERVAIIKQDYRDYRGKHDALASIEMFEAVGEAYWPAYFAKVKESLKPGGRAGLQIITIDDRLFERYRQGVDFIQRYVFPGGLLPSRRRLQEETARAGLAWQGDQGYGQHYALTLRQWRDRFLAVWDRVAAQGFDERFKRMWVYYLAYCEAGFRTGRIDVRQVALTA